MDENVPSAVSSGLRRRGIDVITVHDAGLEGASDKTLLEYAKNNGRVIFTFDSDFLRLATKEEHHAGIIFTRQGTRSIKQVIGRLLLIQDVLTSEDMEGHIEFI